MTATLTIVRDTWFTLNKSQSTDSPDDQKHHILADESFTLLSYEVVGDFMRVKLDGDRLSQSNPFGENLTWSVKAIDVKVVKNTPLQATSVSSFKTPVGNFSSVRLDARPDTDTPFKKRPR
jgi:hypothetical protein